MSGKIDPECLNSRHILINLEVKNDKKKEGKKWRRRRRRMKTSLWPPGKNTNSLKKGRKLGWYQTCQLLHAKHDNNVTVFLKSLKKMWVKDFISS